MAQQHVIYVTRRIHEDVRRHLERAGSVVQWEEDYPIPRQQLLKVIEHVEALFCMQDDRITREVIEAGKQLRVICTMSVRYDHIDITAATERGITVCHTPGLSDDAIADLTMTLLLVFARHLLEAHTFVKERKWKYWSPELFIGTELQGSALGIIGLGRVGIRVAHRALGFAMRVLYHDQQRDVDAEQLIGIQYGSLENVLREADFVTLLVPVTPATRGLINSERLRLMKRNAFIINISGGPVIEHDALVQALSEGRIAGAGLDVFDTEPLPQDEPLLNLPNVVFSPHIGSSTVQALHRMMWMAAEQVIQVLRGGHAAHRVQRLSNNGQEAA